MDEQFAQKFRVREWAARRYGAEVQTRFEELFEKSQSRVLPRLEGWLPAPPRPQTLVARMVTELAQRRYLLEIRQGSGPAGLGARVDTQTCHLVIYQAAILQVSKILGQSTNRDIADDNADLALAVVLSHEFYHVLDPDCPSLLAELSAYLWSSQLTGLFVPL